MKKLTSVIILSIFVLSACSPKVEETSVVVEKKPFIIQTQIIGDKNANYRVEKTGRITAGSNLILTAEGVGEITSIGVKEGSKIKKGARIVTLKDTLNSYDLRVAQAQNSLEIADANKESTQVNLDRAVADSQIAYEQAEKNYNSLLSKNGLIVDTLKNTNQKTLDSYNESYKTYLTTIDGLMTNFLYEGDRIMGTTSAYEYANDGWEPYLGIRVGNALSLAKGEWDKTYSTRGEVRARKEKGVNISPENLQADLDAITLAYAQTQKYVDAVIYMLQNNAIGAGLPQAQQDGWIATWNGIKSQIQGSESGYNAWKAQTLNFFQNYKKNELATKLALDTLDRPLTPEEIALLASSTEMKITYDTTHIDLKDRIANAKLALRQAENTRETALKARGMTLAQLEASRKSGEISLEQAEREYAKLFVSAPFDGSVTRVIASVGQRVNPGTQLLEVVSNSPEVLVDLDSQTVSSLSLGERVEVLVGERVFSGSVGAISRSAGQNLLYTTRISVPGATGFIGSAAVLRLNPEATVNQENMGKNIILPLSVVKIVSEQEGEIVLFTQSGTLEFKSVKLGKIIGDGVYIDEMLDADTEIILSDISNYDSMKFILQKNDQKE